MRALDAHIRKFGEVPRTIVVCHAGRDDLKPQ